MCTKPRAGAWSRAHGRMCTCMRAHGNPPGAFGCQRGCKPPGRWLRLQHCHVRHGCMLIRLLVVGCRHHATEHHHQLGSPDVPGIYQRRAVPKAPDGHLGLARLRRLRGHARRPIHAASACSSACHGKKHTPHPRFTLCKGCAARLGLCLSHLLVVRLLLHCATLIQAHRIQARTKGGP